MMRLRILIATLSMSLAPVAFASDTLPQVSDDGLNLMQSDELRAVYVKPGATLQPYRRVALLDCFVEFRKNWQRDYNASVRGAGRKITDADVARIKKELATEFRKVFTEELATDGGYEVVDIAAEDVLVLRPAIINLDVTAPDKMAPGVYATVVASAGSMTLYLELYDSASNEIIARVIDPKAASRRGGASLGNSVSNKMEADRLLRHWADILREHLDAAQKTASLKQAE
jgi:hypothetical protein